jgi:hypothetical protein
MATLGEEIRRIVNLPVLPSPSDEWVQHFSKQVCPPAVWDDPTFKGLFKSQAWGLASYGHERKLFAVVPAGGGKTTLAYGCAQIAYNNFGHRRILCLTTNPVYEQFIGHGKREARKMLGVDVPTIPLGGLSKKKRLQRAQSERTGMFIMPYSYLSTEDASELLWNIFPTCVIADEAHKLKNIRNAAGPRRLWGTLENVEKHFGSPVDVLLMSGTMTTKGLEDIWHLAKASLRESSPYPLSGWLSKEVSSFMDTRADETTELDTSMYPIVDWYNSYFPSEQRATYNYIGVRRAFSKRLGTAPGVVRIDGGLCDSSLTVYSHTSLTAMNENCIGLMSEVDEDSTAPNGDEIEYGLHKYKWLKELAAGFYNDTYWDEDAWPAEDLARAIEHHAANQEYKKELRMYLSGHPDPGLDTPMLAARHMHSHGAIPGESLLFALWQEQDRLRWDDMPVRSTRPVFVSDHRITQVLEWAQKQKGPCILWCDNIEFRKWLFKALTEAGASAKDMPAGNGKELPLWPERPKDHQFWVMSSKGYTEGLNLQWGYKQAFAQWTRSSQQIEQQIARQHRPGQPEDECEVHFFRNSYFDDHLMSATINGAAYMQQTLGTQQRLMVAAYDPIPRLIPHALLAERIPDIHTPSKEMQQLLLSKFSS